MKLDATDLRYITQDEFRILTAVEMGSKNHEVVPTTLIAEISAIRGGNVNKCLGGLAKRNLVARVQNARYDGYRLTYGGLDYLALRTFSRRKPASVSSVGKKIGVGKESDIHIVKDDLQDSRVLKMHRLGRISFRAIKSKRDYLGKRKSASWMYMSRLAAEKEFAFLKALYSHGFPVPVPIDQARHCIVMSLIDSYPLRSIESVPDAGELYAQLMALIVDFAHAGLIHGDFNEFNILIRRKTYEPVVIDFPQMVSTRHENAEYFFNRDVNCIRRFFRRRFHFEGTSWPLWKDVLAEIKESSERPRIDLEVEASGFGLELQQQLEDYMSNVQDLPDEQESDDEDEDEDEDEAEQEHREDDAPGDAIEAPFDEDAFQNDMAARIEALRLSKALGNDEDAAEASESDYDSDSSSAVSEGPPQSDFTTYSRPSRGRGGGSRAPRTDLRTAVAKKVEQERRTPSTIKGKPGRAKGHKWKASPSHLVGKNDGWE